MITERYFRVKCRVCNSYMLPTVMDGFPDRIKFHCYNDSTHPAFVRLIKFVGKKKLLKFENVYKKVMRKQNIFLDALACYHDRYADPELDWSSRQEAGRIKCRYCPKLRKRMCCEVELLNERLCRVK